MLKRSIFCTFSISALFSILTASSAFSYTPTDFPNYFEELINPSTTSQAKDTTQAEHLVEQTLFSILKRIQVPHVDGQLSDGSPRIITDHFFEKLEKKVREKDRNSKVYISGGVVRSLLGYVYKKLYNAHHRTLPESTEQTLKKIILGHGKKGLKNEIQTLVALGIGSDLDILIELSTENKAYETEIKQWITEFINSAGTASKLANTHSRFKFTLIPVGDVHTYHEQIGRSMDNGGSSLDWLAFPLTPQSGEHMRMPKEHPEIFKKFLTGTYDYFAAPDPRLQSDPDATTIRGLRALLEIPFLHLSPEGVELLKSQLSTLIEKTKSFHSLSEGALAQFEKMIRNARFEGAHNRFYLPHITPVCSEIKTLEELVFQLSQSLSRNEKNIPLIPEFIINKNPKQRAIEDKCQLKSFGLLMDKDKFLNEHTHNGVLYHGTPQLGNILSIIRNGFIASSAMQGSAMLGRGTYLTKNKSTANIYGTPLEFKIRAEDPLRIIDWSDAEKTDVIKNLVEKAREKNIDQFAYLAEYCDIDFIISHHVIIQNSGAIYLPKKIDQMIKMYGDRVPDPNIIDSDLNRLSQEEAEGIVRSIGDYEGFYYLAMSLGLTGIKENLNLSAISKKFLSSSNGKVRDGTAAALAVIKPTDPSIQLALVDILLNPNLRNCDKYASWQALISIRPTDSNVLSVLEGGLESSDYDIRSNVLGLFQYIWPKDLKIILKIVNLLKDSNSYLVNDAVEALIAIFPKNEEVYTALKNLLQHPQPHTQQGAYRVLTRCKMQL